MKQSILGSMVDALWSVNPSVGAPTPEPSLYQIVMHYYRTHFGEDEAKALTERYFASLKIELS
jgi:hypothetical protein